MTDPHLWPAITAATLLAGLHATTNADDAQRFARLLTRAATCAAHFCRTSLDLDWSAWVCEHEVVACGPGHAIEACAECQAEELSA